MKRNDFVMGKTQKNCVSRLFYRKWMMRKCSCVKPIVVWFEYLVHRIADIKCNHLSMKLASIGDWATLFPVTSHQSLATKVIFIISSGCSIIHTPAMYCMYAVKFWYSSAKKYGLLCRFLCTHCCQLLVVGCQLFEARQPTTNNQQQSIIRFHDIEKVN